MRKKDAGLNSTNKQVWISCGDAVCSEEVGRSGSPSTAFAQHINCRDRTQPNKDCRSKHFILSLHFLRMKIWHPRSFLRHPKWTSRGLIIMPLKSSHSILLGSDPPFTRSQVCLCFLLGRMIIWFYRSYLVLLLAHPCNNPIRTCNHSCGLERLQCRGWNMFAFFVRGGTCTRSTRVLL